MDLDGVILDSYQLWDQVVENLLARFDISYTDELKNTLWHLTMDEADEYLLALLPDFYRRSALCAYKKALLAQAYAQVALVPGARELLRGLVALGYPVIAATANRREFILPALVNQDLLPFFQSIYTCQDLDREDKDGLFFQKLCQSEGLTPQNLILIEDSSLNIRQASACGIRGIYLANAIYAPPDDEGTVCVDNLAQLLELLKGETDVITDHV